MARGLRRHRVVGTTAAALASVASLAGAVPAAADDPATLDAALREAREATGAPAAGAAIMRCGGLVWAGADGVMDVSSGREATTETRFVLASTTKPVVAALALGLVERGRLSLRTKLSRFYPRLPGARRITVRMLLDHTNGLNEYFDAPRIRRVIAVDPDHRWTRREVLRAVTRLRRRPGTRYSYSNTGYVVLGGVVEKTGGGSVERLFRARIADPLRLVNSTFRYQPARSDFFAHPYAREDGQPRDLFAPGVGVPADYWGPVWTDGGLASTASDLARFGDALFEGRLLRSVSLRRMTRLDRFGHGLGLFPRQFAGHRWLGHNGAYGGYESEMWHDRARRVTIAVTTNIGDSAPATWERIVAAYDRVAPASPSCPAR